MKQIIIIVVSIVIIIILNMWQMNYLETTSRYMLTDINDIENSLKRGNFSSVARGVENLEQTWNNLKANWDVLGQHDDIENINKHIQSIKVYALYEEKISLTNECILLANEIKNVIENETISFANVL